MDDGTERGLSALAPDRRRLAVELEARGRADRRDARYVGLSTALQIGEPSVIEAWIDAIEGGEPYGVGPAWKKAPDKFDWSLEEDEA